MTKKRKIEILKDMKKYITDDYEHQGMCLAYCVVTQEVGTEERIMDLGIKKPKKTYNGGYWFHPTEKTKRINAINKAIKKLQCK